MSLKFKKSFPIIVACVAAFGITLVLRVILPTPEKIQQYATNDLPLPNIPFKAKEQKTEKDTFVLVAMRDIGQYEKISSQAITWKKWPREGISASFIAKDSDGNMLNSNHSYSNILTLFAKYPISKGTPISISGLSRKKFDEKAKMADMEKSLRKTIEKEVRKEMTTEYKKKLEHEKENMRKSNIDKARNKVRSGMSILTVQIDQRSIASKEFIRVGDRVDLLYNENSHFKKFKNVKILEIDGKDASALLNNAQVGIPKNITIEVEHAKAEELLKYISSGRQAILMVKNQKDVIREAIGSNSVKDLISKKEDEKRRQKFIKETTMSSLNYGNKDETKNAMFKFAMDTLSKDSKKVEVKEQDEKSKSSSPLLNLAMQSFAQKSAENNDNQKTSAAEDKGSSNNIIKKLLDKLDLSARKNNSTPSTNSILTKFANNGFDSKPINNTQNADSAKNVESNKGRQLLEKYVSEGFNTQSAPKKEDDEKNRNLKLLTKYASEGLNKEADNRKSAISNISDSAFKAKAMNNETLEETEKKKGGSITISRKNQSSTVQYDGNGLVVSGGQKNSENLNANLTINADNK